MRMMFVLNVMAVYSLFLVTIYGTLAPANVEVEIEFMENSKEYPEEWKIGVLCLNFISNFPNDLDSNDNQMHSMDIEGKFKQLGFTTIYTENKINYVFDKNMISLVSRLQENKNTKIKDYEENAIIERYVIKNYKQWLIDNGDTGGGQEETRQQLEILKKYDLQPQEAQDLIFTPGATQDTINANKNKIYQNRDVLKKDYRPTILQQQQQYKKEEYKEDERNSEKIVYQREKSHGKKCIEMLDSARKILEEKINLTQKLDNNGYKLKSAGDDYKYNDDLEKIPVEKYNESGLKEDQEEDEEDHPFGNDYNRFRSNQSQKARNNTLLKIKTFLVDIGSQNKPIKLTWQKIKGAITKEFIGYYFGIEFNAQDILKRGDDQGEDFKIKVNLHARYSYYKRFSKYHLVYRINYRDQNEYNDKKFGIKVTNKSAYTNSTDSFSIQGISPEVKPLYDEFRMLRQKNN